MRRLLWSPFRNEGGKRKKRRVAADWVFGEAGRLGNLDVAKLIIRYRCNDRCDTMAMVVIAIIVSWSGIGYRYIPQVGQEMYIPQSGQENISCMVIYIHIARFSVNANKSLE